MGLCQRHKIIPCRSLRLPRTRKSAERRGGRAPDHRLPPAAEHFFVAREGDVLVLGFFYAGRSIDAALLAQRVNLTESRLQSTLRLQPGA